MSLAASVVDGFLGLFANEDSEEFHGELLGGSRPPFLQTRQKIRKERKPPSTPQFGMIAILHSVKKNKNILIPASSATVLYSGFSTVAERIVGPVKSNFETCAAFGWNKEKMKIASYIAFL